MSSKTGLSCLFRLGMQNGVYAEVGAVWRRALLDGDRVTVTRLAELAGEFGLEAEPARLDWTALRTRPFRHPLTRPIPPHVLNPITRIAGESLRKP